MGKLSDVIRHASELSEETDDEDIWEEEETDPSTDDLPAETGTLTDDMPTEAGTSADETPADGEASSEEETAGQAGEDASGPVWNDVPRPENEAAPLTVTDAAGQSEGAAAGTEDDDPSAGEEPDPDEDAEPECNEEGVPLKDVRYAESIRGRGKDLIVVQSVYNRKIIFDMMVRHAYLSTGGYCGLLISLCAIGAAIYTYGKIQIWLSFVLLLAGSMFVVFEPFLLRDRAKNMTRRGGIYHRPILFVLTPYGIELTRNGNHASHDWGDITRVTTTKYAVVLYKGRHTALVLTKKGIGDQKDDLYAMIRKGARNAKYMKLK